nr:uncharacterized protein LOC118682977 [Bactrocera oleae]
MVRISDIFARIIILQAVLGECHGSFFKLTKMECRDVNENLMRVNVCRLKAVKRDVTEATIRLQFLQRVDKWTIHIELLRKYNTYQTFSINKTFDICAFFKNRKEAVYLNILYKLIEKYTNANHSCPYQGELIVDRFRPLHANFILPIPTGDYLLKLVFFNAKTMSLSLFVWFGFKELEKWEKHDE